ncbi:hypothetical protein CKM354_001295000 [Cercospora kikuchii]|uniref:Uncharacterized protein n=1 Tax=Cercospora kikuchii TaxID=84275 RepID=A0A9P3FN02_9PEZI|nr:uncharacterized protein CKM354_001295000 [Cercospora kikuchii]GIZ49934.1 hypothetical protein CKM354_001295000 [Cercospora kikuchii]
MLVGRFNPLAITRLHDPGYFIADSPAVYWNIACGRTPIILISLPRPQELEAFAVWRKMLLTQPPARVVEYGWKFQVPKQGCLPTDENQYVESSPLMKYGALENKAGVTMGEVLDRIKLLEEETQGRFEYSIDSKTVVVGVIDLTANEKLGLRGGTGKTSHIPADELDIDSL